MFDVRKIIIIFVIGVLYAIFSYSLVDAIHPGPDYEDYCSRLMRPMPVRPPAPGTEPINCPVLEEPECDVGGSYFYDYDAQGCPKTITCDYCQLEYDAANEKYSLFMFIIMSVLGLIAIGLGLWLPQKQHPLNEWVATGFMLGGLITLFIGTAIYYADMARIARPIVMLAELVLVVYLAYKKLKK